MSYIFLVGNPELHGGGPWVFFKKLVRKQYCRRYSDTISGGGKTLHGVGIFFEKKLEREVLGNENRGANALAMEVPGLMAGVNYRGGFALLGTAMIGIAAGGQP